MSWYFMLSQLTIERFVCFLFLFHHSCLVFLSLSFFLVGSSDWTKKDGINSYVAANQH